MMLKAFLVNLDPTVENQRQNQYWKIQSTAYAVVYIFQDVDFGELCLSLGWNDPQKLLVRGY